MALPSNCSSSWPSLTEVPRRLFDTNSTDYELIEDEVEEQVEAEMVAQESTQDDRRPDGAGNGA